MFLSCPFHCVFAKVSMTPDLCKDLCKEVFVVIKLYRSEFYLYAFDAFDVWSGYFN